MRFSFCAAAGALAAGILVAQTAATLPQGVEKVTSVEGITEYRLQNGLKVLLFPDPSKQTITVNVTYLVGSRHESYGETGMAHLLEHLLFLGSKKHPDMHTEFSSHGVRRNGTTWLDRTNYFEIFAATDENLKWALDLESDRMVNAFVSKQLLDSQMTVVRNEFERGENEPTRVLMQRTMAVAFDWHNYGNSTIGAKADIENVPIERLQAFYRKYYQPDNAVLTIAGKIDEAKTIAWVNEYFSPIPRPARKLERLYTADPTQDGERTVTVKRVGDTQNIIAAYRTPDGAHSDMAPLTILADVLGDTPSGRLHKALVETKKATSIGGFVWELADPGVMMYMATVRKESNLTDARDTLLRVVHDIITEPPTKEEVERAKKKYLSQMELTLNNSDQVGLMLSEYIASGDWRLLFYRRDNVKKVAPEDVLRVAKTYLKEQNRTVGLFIPVDKPDRAEVPAKTDVAAVLKDFKGGEAVAAGEAFDPSTDNIEKRLIRSSLPNGMKLVLLPKKTRGNNVVATVNLQYGDVESTSSLDRAASMAAGMLLRGTKKHTRQQLQDEFDRLKSRVMPGGGVNATRITVQTTRQNLTELMGLMAEVLREPSFPETEFEQLKQSRLADAERQRSDPQALAFASMNRHLAPFDKGDVRYVRMPDEEAEALKGTTLDAMKAFYNNFYGGSNSELVVVGDFDAEEMKAVAAKLFGDWKSPKKFAKVTYPHKPVEAVNKVIETPDKANATFAAAMPLPIGDEHADYPALLLANYIVGGNSNARLYKRIRTKEGLSYGVGSYVIARPAQDSGHFAMMAIAAPQNIAKVEAAFKEELERALKEGFSEEEVATAKKGWLQAQTVSRSQDMELMMLLNGNAVEGRTMSFQAELAKKISALTPQQLSETLRKHIDLSKISYFKAGDFKQAQAAR